MATEVYNAGFPGDTTLELLKRFNRDVVSREPDLVVLLVGSNDMLYPGHMLEIGEYRKNLNALLDRISAINAGCILMTAPAFLTDLLVENYPGTVGHPLSPEARLELLNQTICETAYERNIELVDLNKLITPVDESAESLILNIANSNRRDGMHFTVEGNRVTAQAVFELIKKCFAETRCIVCFGDSLTYGVYMKGKGSAELDAETYPGQLAGLLNNK